MESDYIWSYVQYQVVCKGKEAHSNSSSSFLQEYDQVIRSWFFIIKVRNKLASEFLRIKWGVYLLRSFFTFPKTAMGQYGSSMNVLSTNILNI